MSFSSTHCLSGMNQLQQICSCWAGTNQPIKKQMAFGNLCYIKNHRRLEVVCLGMLAPRKLMQKRKKLENFKDAADEADQKSWRNMMQEIDETGSAVGVLRNRRASSESLSKDHVLGTLVRLKQLKKWNLVSEIIEWLRTQQWWDFNERDFVMLITAYGKQGDFVKAEQVFSDINKKGYAPNVTSGPEPSALTYQIILKIFVEGNKFKEAEQIFEDLANDEKSPLRPDQKMFHMMIYMHRKAGSYEKAYRLFCLMGERGIQRSTVTFNSLMSFETNYKEVSRIYDQVRLRIHHAIH
ncbi:unnamed protein product [Amaranthus hypochondriacus]